MEQKIVITNDNIRHLISHYLHSQRLFPLPPYLQEIGKWDVSNVTIMENVFAGILNFNEPLNEWNVSNVTNMEGMFSDCTHFNQPLNHWKVSNVTNMKNMFDGCRSFNQPLNKWDVSNVTNMEGMFHWASAFNKDLNDWNVSNVTTMKNMFRECKVFNQPLNRWIVSKVTNMESMFRNCKAFTQPLNSWDLTRDTLNVKNMFDGAPPRGVAFEIHNAYNGINMDEYLSIISKTVGDGNKESYEDIPSYVYEKFKQKIEKLFPDDEQGKLLEELEAVCVRLAEFYNINDPNVQTQIGKTVDYVLLQEKDFIKNYIELFVASCYNAYPDAPGDSISCAKGVSERFFIILGQILFTTPNTERNEIVTKVFGANVLDPNELLKDWTNTWNEFNTDGSPNADWNKKIWKNEEKEMRIKDFKEFMNERYTGNKDADNIIADLVKDYDYVFTNKSEENITYGGRRKRRNLIKRKTVKKRKNIKKRKTVKKRKTMRNIKKRK